MPLTLERYTADLKPLWDGVISTARNGIFLFQRHYMDYHADRFADCSFLIFDDGAPIAAFPASVADKAIISHGGLTFGGLVVGRALRGGDALAAVDLVLSASREAGATRVVVKPVPWAFCDYPAQDAEYALWLRGFTLMRRDLSSVLPLDGGIEPNSSRRGNIKKAQKAGLEVRTSTVDEFYPMLAATLQSQHGVLPAHSMEELRLLQERFPNNILIRCAIGERPCAGAVIYVYGRTWHTQYLSSSPEGRSLGALDLVIASVIEEARAKDVQLLSFGTSTTDSGRSLNEGLLWQKESFGARAIVHDFLAADI